MSPLPCIILGHESDSCAEINKMGVETLYTLLWLPTFVSTPTERRVQYGTRVLLFVKIGAIDLSAFASACVWREPTTRTRVHSLIIVSRFFSLFFSSQPRETNKQTNKEQNNILLLLLLQQNHQKQHKRHNTPPPPPPPKKLQSVPVFVSPANKRRQAEDTHTKTNKHKQTNKPSQTVFLSVLRNTITKNPTNSTTTFCHTQTQQKDEL